MIRNIITKDIIFSQTTPENIYLKYLNLTSFPTGNISSPFSDDKKPSFALYKNGTFKCNSSTKQGDVFQFVAYMKQLDNKTQFNEVLNDIATEMNINQQPVAEKTKDYPKTNKNSINVVAEKSQPVEKPVATESDILLNPIKKPSKTDINNVATEQNPVATIIDKKEQPVATSKLNVTTRDFTKLDLEYWSNLGVEKAILEKYKLKSISSYTWTDKKPFYTKNESVAFVFELQGNFKLYIPNQTEIGIKKNVLPPFPTGIFGFEQLGTGKIKNLIICAGEKDTITANSRGFNSVTFGSETSNPKDEEIKKLQSVCDNLFVCYDNDEPGEKGRNTLIKRFPQIIPLQLPTNENVKGYDITDYFQEHTAHDFQKIIDLAVKNKMVATKNEKLVANSTKNTETPLNKVNNTTVVKEKPVAQPINIYNKYDLPKEVTTPIEDLIEDIEKYKMFMSNDKIWVLYGERSFKPVSNFVVKIIQHMQDEKFPMKLIKIRNVYKQEKIFDVLSDKLNSPQKFDDIVTSHGNYLWSGTPKDFHILKTYLFDKMGNGKKIDCLGWQKEDNFWLWNNNVNLCDGNKIEIDENGIFKHKDISYYVPSANKVYKENAFKYEPQKRVCVKKPNVTIDVYLSKMFEVHRNNSISAILFTISSIFQDIVVDELKAFPILFFHGKASSGKDQLANCCQSFFGKPQSAINIEGGASTLKAHIREFAQFVNIICQFSEYKNGDKQLDGILKGIWDRNGYKRGTIDSHVSTETVPILSSLILTGNHSPDDESLITRLLWLDMSKNTFTDDEVKKYDELADMTEKGISSFTDYLLKERNRFSSDFKTKFRLYKTSISAKMPIGSPSRFSTNLAILGATYEIFKDTIIFPFTYAEMMGHFVKISEFQLNKINSVSASNKWWDCFLVCIKTNGENKLEYERDIKVEGNKLYFNFSNTYDKIQRQWYNQYKETIPSKNVMQDTVKKEKAFIEIKSSCRIGQGRDSSVTSAFVVDFTILSNYEEINEAVHFIITSP